MKSNRALRFLRSISNESTMPSDDPLKTELGTIINSLKSGQLDAMRYLCTGLIPEDMLKEISTGTLLISTLESLDLIDRHTGSCQLIIDLLESPAVKRKDLSKKLKDAGQINVFFFVITLTSSLASFHNIS